MSLTQWGTGTWAANVNESGVASNVGSAMNGNQYQIKGGAAGQIDPNGNIGTFAGTGAGVVRKVP